MNRGMIKQLAFLMRLDKPIGIYLVLWPTLWALWLASAGKPNWTIVCIFIVGSVVMRSAGCVINDIVDHRFDGFVERTRYRPLVAGSISKKIAWSLFVGLLACAFLLVLCLNRFTVLLAWIGLVLAVGYPFLKRVTHLPQLGLGIAFSWGVPMAFAALTGRVSSAGWFVFFGAFVWPCMYDTLYAMVDRSDDVKIGVKSTAILFGKADKTLVGLMQILFLLLLCIVGFIFRLTLPYYLALVVAAGLFVYQQWLIKDRVPANCFKAFLNNHWVGCVIFIGIVLSYVNFG